MDATRWMRENWSQVCCLFPNQLAAQPSAQPPILGIAGAQGSGKSWLAQDMAKLVDGPVAVVSLDDFYLTQAERRRLAKGVHPNLETRGVPGTHDIAHLLETLAALRSGGCCWPKFDKIKDDRMTKHQWNTLAHKPVLIVLEGWCVGAAPQNVADLERPINTYEERNDPSGHWRRFVNDQLAGTYANLFAGLDVTLFLKAPRFDCILDWRLQQERTTYAREGRPMPDDMRGEIHSFIQPFERITRHMLGNFHADVMLSLDAERQVVCTHVST